MVMAVEMGDALFIRAYANIRLWKGRKIVTCYTLILYAQAVTSEIMVYLSIVSLKPTTVYIWRKTLPFPTLEKTLIMAES